MRFFHLHLHCSGVLLYPSPFILAATTSHKLLFLFATVKSPSNPPLIAIKSLVSCWLHIGTLSVSPTPPATACGGKSGGCGGGGGGSVIIICVNRVRVSLLLSTLSPPPLLLLLLLPPNMILLIICLVYEVWNWIVWFM
ncbi:hypothetical protein Hanom_Chr03g00256101 [Helianthus anomalus]